MHEARPVNEDGERANDYALFASLYPRLWRFAAVVSDSDMDPDDLVQDALTATLERQAFAEIRHPEAYLRRAILNVVASRRRRSGILRRIVPRLVGEHSVLDSYPSDLAMLDELAPLDRAAVFLIDVEGLSSNVVAEQLGLTPVATRKRVSRARKKLRLILEATLSVIETDLEVCR